MPSLTAARTATHFESITDPNGRVIQYIHGDEGTGVRLVSVIDPASTEPARRVAFGSAADLIGDDLATSGHGLTVYGTHKWDRPSLRDALSCDRSAGAAILDDCVRRGIGYDDAMVCEAVRKRLNLSQSAIGVMMGLAADNPDAEKRRKNVGRTIRRYETDGAPKLYADALRWLAWRNGVLVDPSPLA